ncbi:MAG TPA: phytanoyl-CoA dioxygenase family protein [Rhizomicrobium sp.]|nr:phytanoyl-CoA dioxygenase family protein [Rhizomicrobium sp.]
MKQGNASLYASHREPFLRDGVVFLEQALAPQHMQVVEDAFTWKLQNAGKSAEMFYPELGATILQATGNSVAAPSFQQMLFETPLTAVVAALFDSDDVWYLEEQVWLKEGGAARRTPWHQDSSYYPFEGPKSVVLWIPLDDLKKENSLDVVRGSFKGKIFNGTAMDIDDDTLPLYSEDDLPRLPNIEKERDKWDIVSWPIKRGDILAFHSNALHGGAPTAAGMRRRSLTLRFIGDDVKKTRRPQRRQGADSYAANAKKPDVAYADIEDSAAISNLSLRIDHALRPGEAVYRVGVPKVRG